MMGLYLSYKRAKEKLSNIDKNPEPYILISYASSSTKEDAYPRIACISLQFLVDGTRKQFSISKYLYSSDTDIEAEKKLLKEFYQFVAEYRTGYFFIHWNMNSSKHGFVAIENRYKVLFEVEPEVRLEELRKIDLDDIIEDIYSKRYVDHPKMYNLYNLNNFDLKYFVKGSKEAELFEQKEWYQIESCSKSKVDFLDNVLNSLINRSLKTQRRFGSSMATFWDKIQYYSKETRYGKSIVWLLNILMGALLGILFERLFR